MKFTAVIVYHAKDHAVLRHAVTGIKQYLEPETILLVTSAKNRSDVCSVAATWIDEDVVVTGVNSESYSDDRWGWYFQQILKLGMHAIVGTKYYLVVDADTVFLRPTTFFSEDGIPLYARSKEYHAPYLSTIEAILGFVPQRNCSFITHHMLFDRDLVREMLGRFRPRDKWWECIARYRLPLPPWNSSAQFSEYETYCHYLQYCHPESYAIRDLSWTIWPFIPTHRDLRRLSRWYDFVSMHDHLRSVKLPIRQRVKWSLRRIFGV